MMIDRSLGRRIFFVMNGSFFILYAVLCMFPIVHILAISLSKTSAVVAGEVSFLPVDFTMKSYEHIISNERFWDGMKVSLTRIALGVPFAMIITILAAYPLSRSVREFRTRTVFVWLFLFTMLFNGGLIPTYMIVRNTGLLNSIWALIIPSAIAVFNIVLLMNFFRNIPKEMDESAYMDGAGHWQLLWKIYLPLSLPALAVLVIFTFVGLWNSWFDGMIYMKDADKYPLQTYLQSILVDSKAKLTTRANAELMRFISDRTVKAAQVFIATIPVLIVYPLLQRYFIGGIMLGSVKE
jgi:putative aldouronate transport system permease protein